MRRCSPHALHFFSRRDATIGFLFCLILVVVTACDAGETAQPTEIPITILAPSATVAPIVPTVPEQDTSNVNVSAFTPAAGGISKTNPAVTTTPSPLPTEVVIPLSFVTSDGLTIVGDFYGAPARPAPTVLLLHANDSNKGSWRIFAAKMQSAGYNLLAIDLRGHGETGGTVDWAKTPNDVELVLSQLKDLSGVDTSRISVIGASIGANLALVSCAETQLCKSVVMLSPALNFGGIETAKAMEKYGEHPVMIIASRDETPSGSDSQTLDKLAKGEHTLSLYDGTVHGVALLNTQLLLTQDIIAWLAAH